MFPLLAFMLALPLLLGHACELWAVVGIVHVHETDQHSSDQHPDEKQVSCDVLVGVPSNIGGHPDVLPSLDAAAPRVFAPVPSLIVVAQRQESSGPPQRLPLFLLHASLLI